MAVVRSFVEFKFRDTIDTLHSVLRLALRGEVLGIAICVLTPRGEEYGFTGRFRDGAPEAFRAAARIKWKINQVADLIEAEESRH